jgi:predicted nucleic acid-binding protein
MPLLAANPQSYGAKYNLTLTDAIQAAAAMRAACDAFLTNDRDLRRVRELMVLVLEELEL